MPYLEPLPVWLSPGIEPPLQLKTDGWRYTQRPPASYFDWFQFSVYYALKELQENAIHQERLYNSTDSTDATKAATANSVKLAYDRAVTAESSAKSYADTKVAGIVDAAPTTLDTLNELAQALGDDPNFATSMTNLIGTKIASSEKGAASGVATLGTDSKVPLTQLTDSSISQKGIVQLSSSTASTSETTAATSKAIKDVKDAIPVLNDTVTSTSTIQAATANAVKTANDNVNNHKIAVTGAHNASAIAVTDPNSHFTGINVETVLDELFTFANNGKTSIANVVGAPTVSSDTFTKMTSDIQTIKDAAATHLTAKGQASTGSESLSQLVNKLIALNP